MVNISASVAALISATVFVILGLVITPAFIIVMTVWRALIYFVKMLLNKLPENQPEISDRPDLAA